MGAISTKLLALTRTKAMEEQEALVALLTEQMRIHMDFLRTIHAEFLPAVNDARMLAEQYDAYMRFLQQRARGDQCRPTNAMVAWLWHVDLLHPQSYVQLCISQFGRVVEPVAADWAKSSWNEPLPSNSSSSGGGSTPTTATFDSADRSRRIDHLHAQSVRQAKFVVRLLQQQQQQQKSMFGADDAAQLVWQYIRFLQSCCKTTTTTTTTVTPPPPPPSIAVEFVWNTHLRCPNNYGVVTTSMCGGTMLDKDERKLEAARRAVMRQQAQQKQQPSAAWAVPCV